MRGRKPQKVYETHCAQGADTPPPMGRSDSRPIPRLPCPADCSSAFSMDADTPHRTGHTGQAALSPRLIQEPFSSMGHPGWGSQSGLRCFLQLCLRNHTVKVCVFEDWMVYFFCTVNWTYKYYWIVLINIKIYCMLTKCTVCQPSVHWIQTYHCMVFKHTNLHCKVNWTIFFT